MVICCTAPPTPRSASAAPNSSTKASNHPPKGRSAGAGTYPGSRSPPNPDVSPDPSTPNMPRRIRAGACRVPPSALASEPSASGVCSGSPPCPGSTPRAASGPLTCADDWAPPVGSAFSLLVPVAFSSAMLLPVLHRRRHQLGPVSRRLQLRGPLAAQRLVHDLGVDLEDRVHEHLGARRAAREVHVDGDDVVHALDDGVVVEHPSGAG